MRVRALILGASVALAACGGGGTDDVALSSDAPQAAPAVAAAQPTGSKALIHVWKSPT
jgi:hypothetical protein